MLAQLLIADQVQHSWQGTTLLTHESAEAEVDGLIEEAKAAENPEIDPDKPKLAFEMDGWSSDLQASLVERLGAASVPHLFDSDGDLVVHEEDEEHVEMLIEDLMARAAEQDMEELDGLAVNGLLSDMFEAADRLKRDTKDGDGVLAAIKHGRRLATVATPFGFSSTSWAALRDRCAAFADMLEGDDSDEDVVSAASDLRDALQRII